MRVYIGLTGLVFALMFAAHVARVYIEGTQLLGNPVFLATSAVSLVFAVWAVLLLTKGPRPR